MNNTIQKNSPHDSKELRGEVITEDLILAEIKTSFEEDCIYESIEVSGKSMVISYLNGQKFEISVSRVK